MTISADEERPLLPSQPQRRTPLPWTQFTIVMLLQVAEPLTMQLIRDIGITNGNESYVGYYVGLLQSLFFLTQAATVLHWSRMSDFIGRKPVVLIGLFGLSISMTCFGLSQTFWTLVLSRCLNGALNGNVGIIKSMMAELTDSTNIAQAYAYLPIAWSTGGALGPIIGGSLSRPVEQFPEIFGNNAFLEKYPYFLPSAVPAVYSALIWIIAFFYLKETHKSPTPIPHLFRTQKFEDSTSSMVSQQCQLLPEDEKPLPLRALLVPRIILSGGNYAVFAMFEVAFRTIQPLFLSTPIALGGLGLAPSLIGKILCVYGVLNGIFQMLFFARIHDRIGTKMTFVAGILCAFPCFLAFPVISYLAKMQGLSISVWLLLVLQTTMSIGLNLSYGEIYTISSFPQLIQSFSGAIFIFIAASSPNRASLGATNGLCQVSLFTNIDLRRILSLVIPVIC
ncbi:hypothetical protein H0H92_005135 [Tricholoma furcatifolium]|nr:hypothetical protein H0H92_005135 [Tricholoma furcatifolium]